MKIRIRGNTLRFRLGITEVASLAEKGFIEERVRFGPDSRSDLYYTLKKARGDLFSGSFSDGRITVSAPASIIDGWAAGNQISIEGKQVVGEQNELRFLIEKDFVCLNAHNDEDQSDRYPHPRADIAC